MKSSAITLDSTSVIALDYNLCELITKEEHERRTRSEAYSRRIARADVSTFQFLEKLRSAKYVSNKSLRIIDC